MFARSVVLIAALVAVSCSRQAPSLAGDWDATIVNLAGAEVPFRFVIGGTPDSPTGTFVNGDERMASTGGTFDNGQLTIAFDQYGSKVIARLNGDVLEGEYNRSTRGAAYPFHCTRIADGTRTIEVGTAVRFDVVPGHLGRWEATAIERI